MNIFTKFVKDLSLDRQDIKQCNLNMSKLMQANQLELKDMITS
jgi:hypothetical protein